MSLLINICFLVYIKFMTLLLQGIILKTMDKYGTVLNFSLILCSFVITISIASHNIYIYIYIYIIVIATIMKPQTMITYHCRLTPACWSRDVCHCNTTSHIHVHRAYHKFKNFLSQWQLQTWKHMCTINVNIWLLRKFSIWKIIHMKVL